jgi:hypothetical protein
MVPSFVGAIAPEEKKAWRSNDIWELRTDN